MKKSHESKVISGALVLALSSVILKILGLLYKVPLSYILSDEGMGYFNTAYTVYTFFYIISTAGVPKSISILISKSDAEGNKAKSFGIYRTAFVMYFTAGTVFTVLLCLFAANISQLVGSTYSYLSIITIAPSIMFVSASGVIRGYFNAKIKLLPVAVSEVISGVARLVLGLLFALIAHKLSADLYLISAMTISGTSLGSFAGFWYLYIYKKHSEKEKKNSESKVVHLRANYAKEILGLSLPLTLTSMIGAIGNMSDTFIIMRKLMNMGYSELQAGILYGNYTTLVIPMLNLAGALIAPISAVILPLITKYNATDKGLMGDTLTTGMRITSMIVFPITVIFTLCPYEILGLIFEEGGAAMAASLLTLIAPALVFMSLSTILNTAIEGMGNVKLPLVSLLLGTLLKIILTILTMQNQSLEMLGAPLSTTFSYFLGFIISILYLTYVKKVKLNILSSILLPFLSAAISGVAFYTIYRILFKASNKTVFIVSLALFALIYGVLNIPELIKSYKTHKKLSNCTKTEA